VATIENAASQIKRATYKAIVLPSMTVITHGPRALQEFARAGASDLRGKTPSLILDKTYLI